MRTRPRSQLVHSSDPVLRRKARAVGEDTDTLLNALFRECERGGAVGVAAPQIGVSERVAVVVYRHLRIALVNPEIRVGFMVPTREDVEGCLSLPDRRFRVRRPAAVTVTTFVDPEHPLTLRASGIVARIVRHEIDHLDGVLVDAAGLEIKEAA